MEEALIGLLVATAGVTALVGTSPVRIYWGRAPQNVAIPFVVLTRISGVPDYHHTGASGLVESRIQMDAYGTTYASAKTVARALEARLSGYSGTTGGKKFSSIFKDAERDMTEDEASPDKLFRTSQDFILWHN